MGSFGNHKVVGHMRVLLHGEVAGVIQKVQASNARPVAKLAFKFLLLTAHARW